MSLSLMSVAGAILTLLFTLPLTSSTAQALPHSFTPSQSHTSTWIPPPVQHMPTPEFPFFYPSIQKTFGTVTVVSILIPASQEHGLDYYVPGYMGANTMFTISKRTHPYVYGEKFSVPIVELDNVSVAAGHFSIDDWRLLPRARRPACFISARHPVVRVAYGTTRVIYLYTLSYHLIINNVTVVSCLQIGSSYILLLPTRV
jgi:hypothetical protein